LHAIAKHGIKIISGGARIAIAAIVVDDCNLKLLECCYARLVGELQDNIVGSFGEECAVDYEAKGTVVIAKVDFLGEFAGDDVGAKPLGACGVDLDSFMVILILNRRLQRAVIAKFGIPEAKVVLSKKAEVSSRPFCIITPLRGDRHAPLALVLRISRDDEHAVADSLRIEPSG